MFESASLLDQQLNGFSDVINFHLNFVEAVGYELELTLVNRNGQKIMLVCENLSLLDLRMQGGLIQLFKQAVFDLRSEQLDLMKYRFDWKDQRDESMSFCCARAHIVIL